MTNRFDISKAPLRAEPRHPAAAAPVQSVPATPGGLIRSTLLAAGAAGAILVLFWLPAEYGIDPTGVGGLTGLTEMGDQAAACCGSRGRCPGRRSCACRCR